MSQDPAPLKYFIRINPEALAEDTPSDREVRYIDIASTGRGKLVEPPELTTFGQAPSRARRVVRQGDTLISTVRTYLRAVWTSNSSDRDLVASTGFAVLRPREGIDPGFLGWLAQSDAVIEKVVASSVGVGYPAINSAAIGTIKVALPALETQRRITQFLDSQTAWLDHLIEKKLKMVALAQESANAMLLGAIGPASGSPEVPLRRLLRKLDRPASGEIVTAFRDGHVMLRSRRRHEGFTESDTQFGYQGVRRGDVVFHGLDGFAGAVGVSEDDGMCSPVYQVCATAPGVDGEYVAMALRALALSGYLMLQAGNVRERAVDFRNWKRLAQIRIPLPIGHRIVAEAYRARRDWAESVVGLIRRQLAVIEERRRTLVADAVTGRINVTDAA